MNLSTRRRDTEALLDGEPLERDSGLDDVEAFLADVRLEFGALPAPAPRPTLAATLDGRRELRPASAPKPKLTFPERRPRSHRLRPVVVVFATGTVLFGGLATAGALPGPAQRATAELSSHLGIHLPGATTTADVDGGSKTGTSRTTVSAGPSTSLPGTSPTTAAVDATDPTANVPAPSGVPGVPIAPPTTPTTSVAGVPPTLPPPLPDPEPPALPSPQNPLEQLLDRLLGGLLSP